MGNTLPRLLLALLLFCPQVAIAKTKPIPTPSTPPLTQNSVQKVTATPVTPKATPAPGVKLTENDGEMDQTEQQSSPSNPESNSFDEEQDPQAEEESDSVVPKTEENPFQKVNIDTLVQRQFNDDMWRIMRGGLPCVETTSVCLQQLQSKAVAQSPLLKEIDNRIQEANQKIDEAKARNQKSIKLSILTPALQYMLGPAPSGNNSSGKRNPGFFDRVARLFTGNVGIINDLLSVVGIPLFQGTQSGNDQAQSRAIQISDIQVKIAELQRQRAQLADTIREKVTNSLLQFDESRTEFQTSQVLATRSLHQFKIFQMRYARGNSDTETYLSMQNALDRTKSQTYASWAKMRRSLFQLKLLVLNVQEAEN